MVRKTMLFAMTLSFVVAGRMPADDERTDSAKDYSEFSRILHKIVVAQVPKYVEDNSGWGGSIPIPDKLPLPRLRTRIKVGDHEELPHGLWRKLRVNVDDPDKDVAIQVRSFEKIDAKTYRLSLDSQAAIRGEVE